MRILSHQLNPHLTDDAKFVETRLGGGGGGVGSVFGADENLCINLKFLTAIYSKPFPVTYMINHNL